MLHYSQPKVDLVCTFISLLPTPQCSSGNDKKELMAKVLRARLKNEDISWRVFLSGKSICLSILGQRALTWIVAGSIPRPSQVCAGGNPPIRLLSHIVSHLPPHPTPSLFLFSPALSLKMGKKNILG